MRRRVNFHVHSKSIMQPPVPVLITTGFAAAAAAYFAWRYSQKSKTQKPAYRVLVASTAAQKLQAVENSIGAAGSVKGVKVDSGVAEQPVGLENTQHGAKNRLWSLLDACESELADFDLAVSVENGLVKGMAGEEMETWFDVAVVYVKDLRTGAEATATSAGVRIAATVVGQWLEDGMEGTVGEIIAEQMGGDKQDPHASLTSGAYPRGALLEHAILVAHSQLALAPTGDEPAGMRVAASDD